MSLTVHVGTGTGQMPSIGEALADPRVTEVVIAPGVYEEHLVIGPRRAPLLVRSSSDDPADVVVTFDLSQGDRAPSGMVLLQDCATVTVDADDVTIRALTIANTFDREAFRERGDLQALALRTRGTRIRVERCRLLGQQDTVLLDSPSWGVVTRVELVDCLIEGTIDFVYGKATALIRGGEIRSVGPGYVAAPCTGRENPHGFLFHGVRLTAADGVPHGSVHLARPWHPGGWPHAVGQALFVDCEIGPHVAAERWAGMGGYDWANGGRFAETGSRLAPGAVPPSPDHARELSDAESVVTQHLALWGRPGAPVASHDGRIHIFSDSTASDYPTSRAPRTGWGQVLREVSGRDVRNHAVSGMSTQSLLDSGHLDACLPQVRPGDLVLVGFGHNDAKPDERYASVSRGYPANLRRVLLAARARGAQPVLITPVARRSFADGHAQTTHGGYPAAVRRLAAECAVPLIDLTSLTRSSWEAAGEEGSKAYFLHLAAGQWVGYPDGERDDTHLSASGARVVAEIVTRELIRLELHTPKLT